VNGLSDLRAAIEALEARRNELGAEAVQTAVGALRERLTALEQAAPTVPEGERKQVTVMFADVSGFTALAETTDAEDVRNLLNAYFERIGQVVARYGGYIDKFIGDELMALFGAPLAMEDHGARALYAALEIRDTPSVGEHRQVQDLFLTLHLGINSGLVVAGAIGTEAKREYTVMGDPVNVAARLVTQAKAGEILVGASTQRLVGDRFQFESLGSMKLKGRSQPQEVYRLLGTGSTMRAVGGARLSSRMIGREAELHTIQEAFQDVMARRRPRSIAVVGPAGIGKSRLQQEFRDWLKITHPEAYVLHGTALPHTMAAPYFIVGELIRNSLGVKETDSAADIRRRLESAQGEVGTRDPDVVHALAAIMAVEYEEDRFKDLTPEERRDRIFSAFVAFVKQAAARSPVLLLFEDLHWIDDLSMDLVEHLFGELAETPVLFLTVTRPILDPEAKPRQVESRVPREAHTRIVLRELEEKDGLEFVRSLARGLDRRPEMVQAIARKGEGNPFFIEEIVGTLTDQGILVRDEHGVQAVGRASDLAVPDTVWGVLAERIDRLSADEKRVIQSAAIVGQLFWEGLVRELAELEPRRQLNTLSQRDFVYGRGPAAFADDWEWKFRHILVQEVGYSSLLRETRKAGHLKAAGWLEQRVGDRRNEYATLLAHHYQLGEHWAKTAEFAELAGDRATVLFAHREARASYLQASHALGLLETNLETRRRLIDVTLKLARVAFYTATEEVLQALEAAQQLADEIDDEEREVRVITAKASWLYMAGRTRPAVETAMHSVARATRAGLEELLVAPYLILGRAMFALGEYSRCVEMLEKSNALAEAYADNLDEITVQARAGSSLGFLGMAYQMLGEVEKGRALSLESLRMAEPKRDLSRIASAHLYLAVPPCLFGLLEEAGEHLRKAVTIGEDSGDLSVVYVARGLLGYWQSQRGELQQAEESLDRALALAAELDSFLFVSLIEAYRAEVDVKAGKAAAAVTRAERAVAKAKEDRQKDCEGTARRVLGWARYYAQPDARDEVERELRAAVDIHKQTGSRVLVARESYELVEYLRLVNREAAAAEVAAEASSITRELGLDWLPLPPPAPGSPPNEVDRG